MSVLILVFLRLNAFLEKLLEIAKMKVKKWEQKKNKFSLKLLSNDPFHRTVLALSY